MVSSSNLRVRPSRYASSRSLICHLTHDLNCNKEFIPKVVTVFSKRLHQEIIRTQWHVESSFLSFQGCEGESYIISNHMCMTAWVQNLLPNFLSVQVSYGVLADRVMGNCSHTSFSCACAPCVLPVAGICDPTPTHQMGFGETRGARATSSVDNGKRTRAEEDGRGGSTDGHGDWGLRHSSSHHALSLCLDSAVW